MKGSEEKNGIPAAALAWLARTAAGAGWPGVLAVSAAAALLRRLRGNACVPRWLRAVQALFDAFVLCQALTWAGASWQGAGNGMWIGLILLGLALWLAHKGPEAVQAASGVLGLAEVGLLAAVMLGSLRQIRPENLLPGVGLPDGWLLVALLLPGGGRRQGWLWALAFCLTAAGVGWVGENAFLLLSRSASGMGSVRRLESLAAVGLALGFFLMMTQLLSQEHPGDRIWSAALAAALFLGGFRINGWLAALCAATAWYFLPTMCEKRKIKDKMENKMHILQKGKEK